jgi:uncharacterized surface protein with fasciclin (FAS1) repeats
MTIQLRTSLFMILAVALVAVGCDQSEQNVGFTPGDTYRITIGSAAGGASTASASIPDTVSYYVEGYTTRKDYTWTVNDTNPPILSSKAPETHRWAERNGEFITVVYSEKDGIADAPLSGEGSNTITVDAVQSEGGDDGIETDTISTTATLNDAVASQISRFSVFSTLTSLAATASLVEPLNDSTASYTLFAPTNTQFGALADVSPLPTNAVDGDEPGDSGMLADFLKYHVVADSVRAEDLTSGDVPTLLAGESAGSSSTININAGEATVNGNAITQVDIPATNGAIHKLGGVLLPPVASADFTDQEIGTTDSVTVAGAYLPEGGFVVLHDSTALADQGPIPSVVGVSDYLEAGIHTDVRVEVDGGVSATTTIGAMPHVDSNGNESYDFPSEDGPYIKDGDPVLDFADIAPVASD